MAELLWGILIGIPIGMVIAVGYLACSAIEESNKDDDDDDNDKRLH